MSKISEISSRLFNPILFAYALSGALAGGAFVTTFMIARMAGPVVIGQYALAISTANLLMVLCIQGLDRILIREIAGDLRQNLSSKAKRTFWHLSQHMLLVALFTACVWGGVLVFTPISEVIGGQRQALLVTVILLPVSVLFRSLIAAIRASQKPLKAQIIEVMPAILLPLFLLPLWMVQKIPDTAELVAMTSFMHVLAICAGIWLLRPIFRGWGSGPSSSVAPSLRTAGLTLMAAQACQMLCDWFILVQISTHLSAAETGAFRVAIQIITIFTTLIATSEQFVSPRMAGDFRTGRADLAWKRYRQTSWIMLFVTGPFLLLCFFAAEPMLRIAFGSDFAVAATALTIMTGAQLINVARGPIGGLFTMANRTDLLLKMTMISTLVGFGASFFLIPIYGLKGAALAQSLPLVLRAGMGIYLSRRYLPREASQPLPDQEKRP